MAAPTEHRPLGLFDAFGIELEYMIVDADSLDVAAAADILLESAAGAITAELERDAFAWNNELARHVIEFKTNGPRGLLDGAADGFAAEVSCANELLAAHGLRLMPTGMHPWMDPASVQLWNQEGCEIYGTFDRIFSCRGHGWANLQSMHLNLPFSGDEEFGRLHAATRFLLPVMPGLTASSPLMDGRLTGKLDNRLAVYRRNCARVPSITGAVIPEPVYTIGAYHDKVLSRIYADLEPLDPRGVLQHEWVNARGAIPRFERMALEIRILDTQECPAADIAYAGLVVSALRALCAETWIDLASLKTWRTEDLAQGLLSVIEKAETTEITDSRYLRALGVARSSARVRDVWAHLADRAAAAGALHPEAERVLEHYLRHGSLASRIVAALPLEPQHGDLRGIYEKLCDCLANGELYID